MHLRIIPQPAYYPPKFNPSPYLNSNCWRKVTSQGLLQIIRICVSVHSRSDRDISIGNSLSVDTGNFMLGRPDFVAGSLLLVVVLGDDLAYGALEVQRTHLHLWVEEAVDEDAGVEVLLCVDAEVFVLGHDAFVHVTDEVEGFVGGILVAVDLVAHDGLRWAHGSEALHEEEVWTVF